MIDLDGEIPFFVVTGLIGAVIGGIVGGVIAAANGGNVWTGIATGAIAGALIGSGVGMAAGATLAGSAFATTSAVVAGTNALAVTASTSALAVTGTNLIISNQQALSIVAPQLVTQSLSYAYKAFTSAYFRHNLAEMTGRNPFYCQAHHVLPQADRFSRYWYNAGINIHDPRYGSWVETGKHLSMSYQYNLRWDMFFRAFPNANASQILSYARQLSYEFDFITYF